jgi:hypothetical protein
VDRLNRIAVETTSVAVLADGSSAGAISHRRGHLLEEFLAQLLGVLGYSEPRREHLNVTSQGIEIDVVAEHKVTRQKLMAECKAYSAAVRVPEFEPFVGKYLLARTDDDQLAGVFLGLPRLTPDAKEQADKLESKAPAFRYLGSKEVVELLVGAKLLPDLDGVPPLSTDLTVVITEHGLALAARELDPQSRRATRTLLWSMGSIVPDPVVALVERDLSEGLPVVRADDGTASVAIRRPPEPTIVAVRQSTSDFEYQLPAAPRFFVGRKTVEGSLVASITDRSGGGTLVVNAKSGWGKSSLALRLARRVTQAGGVALVVDSRTAERPEFVAAAVERLLRDAQARRLIVLPESAAFSSLASTIRSLRDADWKRGSKPLMLFFDQFENVFRDADLTREFRDLAVLVSELTVPVTVGFAWKTDLVGWTEDHPYQLRDEIRDGATLAVLDPLGPREIETLLRRLEKAVGEKLHRELRARLREVSQGLPWLFKKLAGHIIAELTSGATQEQLVRESLNVQTLFESDLAELSPAEQEGLRAIARSAPALVSDLEESVPSGILLSLFNRRLVVQVGERIDTYWDTFRDFLLTGRVAIEDSYMVRYAPSSGVSKLLRIAIADDGELSVPSAATTLSTSTSVIFNYARELRQFGLISAEANRIVVAPSIMSSSDREHAVRLQVAAALRRHRILSVVLSLFGDGSGPVPLTRLAQELPTVFPAVEANAESWLTYARAFAQWLSYAGLVSLTRDGVERAADGDTPQGRLLSGAVPVRVRSAFPQAPSGPAAQLLLHLADPSNPRPPQRSFRPALRDLALLNAVELDDHDHITLTDHALVADGAIDAVALRRRVESMPGLAEAFELLTEEPAASPQRVAACIANAHGAEWAHSTALSIGKYVRSWARECGVETKLRASGPSTGDGTLQLDVD